MFNRDNFDKWYYYSDRKEYQTPFDKFLDAYKAGFDDAMKTPTNTVEVKAGQVLSRDERDALIAANAFLAVSQSEAGDGTILHNRIQKIIDAIGDMLYAT